MAKFGVMIGMVGLTISQSTMAQQATRQDYSASAAEDSQATAPANTWKYSTEYDRLRGVTNRFANLSSENAQNFSAPYDGGSKLNITVRKMGNRPEEVLFIIERGQIVCGIENSMVIVRFDYDRPQPFFCDQPDDGDTSVVFIRPTGKFLKRLFAATNMTIELTIFQQGSRQFSFLSEGLKW